MLVFFFLRRVVFFNMYKELLTFIFQFEEKPFHQ